MVTIPQPTTPARKVAPRTREVIAYDHDPAKPGKPLHLLIPGGLLAVAAFVAAIYVGYRTWYQQSMDATTGGWLLVVLGAVWFLSLFLFSYGYTLYDTGKAVKMTLLIGIVGVLIVAIVIALFVVFREDSGGGGGGGGRKWFGRDSGDRILDIDTGDPGPAQPPPPVDAGNVGPQPAMATVRCPGCGANRPVPAVGPCAICGTVLPG